MTFSQFDSKMLLSIIHVSFNAYRFVTVMMDYQSATVLSEGALTGESEKKTDSHIVFFFGGSRSLLRVDTLY